MRARHILMAARLAVSLLLVSILSSLLTSIMPLMMFLEGLGVANPTTMLRIMVAVFIALIIIRGESIGWIISLTYLMCMIYLVMVSSPLIKVAFPSTYGNLIKTLENSVVISPASAFSYLLVLIIILIVNGYLEDLLEKERLMDRMGIPMEDITSIVYPSLLIMTVVIVISVLMFLWAIDYLTGRKMDLGQLYYLAPSALLLALGVSFSMGIFDRSEVRRIVLVVKVKVPVGERFTWDIEGEEDILVTISTKGNGLREKEIMIDQTLRKIPKKVILQLNEPTTEKVRLMKAMESIDGDTLFLLYTNIWPVELGGQT